VVSSLDDERTRLAALAPGAIERAEYVDLIRLRDPDDNLVVVTERRNR
jgi:hypothetical protein